MNENKFEVPQCGRCKKPIMDVAYVEVGGAIVLQKILPPEIPIFKTPEHAENYAQRIPMHPDCWIDTLKDHGAKLHNMAELIKNLQLKAAKEKQEGDKK